MVEVAAGETVFHKGDAGDRFYVIESGRAEIVAGRGAEHARGERRQLR